MKPDPQDAERFDADLLALLPPDAPFGVAVSGGPDSLSLLLLAAAVRPGNVAAATVDHKLRPESRAEAEAVGQICRELGVPHAVLTASWLEKPTTGLQEMARKERYRLLGEWAEESGLRALVTAHHLDDQAETLLMRLARGAGVRGLASMRAKSRVPGAQLPLLRPLLGWRRQELERICKDAGLDAVADPSNIDERFERVRVRRELAASDWLEPVALARSAAFLGEADAAIEWGTQQEWLKGATNAGVSISYRPSDAPREIRRRIVSRAIGQLSTEGKANPLRGKELERLLSALEAGNTATVRGVRCEGGFEWHFSPAPSRRE